MANYLGDGNSNQIHWPNDNVKEFNQIHHSSYKLLRDTFFGGSPDKIKKKSVTHKVRFSQLTYLTWLKSHLDLNFSVGKWNKSMWNQFQNISE